MSSTLHHLPLEILSTIFSSLSFPQTLGIVSLNWYFRRLAHDQVITEANYRINCGKESKLTLNKSIFRFKNLASFSLQICSEILNTLAIRDFLTSLPKSLTTLRLDTTHYQYLLSPSLPKSLPLYAHLSNKLSFTNKGNSNVVNWTSNNNPWFDWEANFPNLLHLDFKPSIPIHTHSFNDFIGDTSLGEWFMLSLPKKLISLRAWIPFQTRTLKLLPSIQLNHLEFSKMKRHINDCLYYSSNSNSNSEAFELHFNGDEFLEFIPDSVTSLAFPAIGPQGLTSIRFCHRFASTLIRLQFSLRRNILETWNLVPLLRSLEYLGAAVNIENSTDIECFNFISLAASQNATPFPENLKTLHLQIYPHPHPSIRPFLVPWLHLLPKSLFEFDLLIEGKVVPIWPLEFSKMHSKQIQRLGLPAIFSPDHQVESLPRFLKSLTLHKSHRPLVVDELKSIFTNFPLLTFFKLTNTIDESIIPIFLSSDSPIQRFEMFRVATKGQFFKTLETPVLPVLCRREIERCFRIYLQEISSNLGKSICCSYVELNKLTRLPNGISRIDNLFIMIDIPNLPKSLTSLSALNDPIKANDILTYFPNLKYLKRTHILIESETVLAILEPSNTFYSDAWVSTRILPHISKKLCIMSYENPEEVLNSFNRLKILVTSNRPCTPSLLDVAPNPVVLPDSLEVLTCLRTETSTNVVPILSSLSCLAHLRIRLDLTSISSHAFLCSLPSQLILLEVIKCSSVGPMAQDHFDLDDFFQSNGTLPCNLKTLHITIPTKLSPQYYSYLPKSLKQLHISMRLLQCPAQEELARFHPALKDIKFGRRKCRGIIEYLSHKQDQ